MHDDYYVDRVEALGAGEDVPDCQEYGLGTPDTPAFPGMDEAARWLVGGTLHGARLICDGTRSACCSSAGGCTTRGGTSRPGSASTTTWRSRSTHLTRHGLWVAYLDIDVHHGDGVQQILYDDRRVMTISLHESGQFLFPGTGAVHELGSGVGPRAEAELPLEPFTEGESYLEVLDEVVPAALAHFRPGVLVVQAGADAHFDDPLADLMLTTRDYEGIFRRILDWADTFTAGRVLFTLGGGYSFRAAPRVWALLYLADSRPAGAAGSAGRVAQPMERHVRSAAAATVPRSEPGRGRHPEPRRDRAPQPSGRASGLLEAARQYWF